MEFKTILYDLFDSLHIANSIAYLLYAIITIVITIVVGKLIQILINKAILKVLGLTKDTKRSITLAKLIKDIVKYVVWFIVALVILSVLNINIAPFLASAGVLGLAIGFGAQEIVKDFISGFFILFEGVYNVDDVIEIDGFKGNVLEIGFRTTVIQNWKGERKTINNGDVKGVINYSRAQSIAIIDFGVAYDTDVVKMYIEINNYLATAKEKYENIEEIPTILGMTEMANSSINFRITAKTKPMQHFAVERGIREDLYKLFKEKGIEIPFPQVVVHHGRD